MPDKKPRFQGDHPSLFHKRQVKVGVEFQNIGRTDHNSVWRIMRIRHHWKEDGKWWVRSVQAAETYQDDMTLRNVETGETRTGKVAGFEYSAVWVIRK